MRGPWQDKDQSDDDDLLGQVEVRLEELYGEMVVPLTHVATSQHEGEATPREGQGWFAPKATISFSYEIVNYVPSNPAVLLLSDIKAFSVPGVDKLKASIRRRVPVIGAKHSKPAISQTRLVVREDFHLHSEKVFPDIPSGATVFIFEEKDLNDEHGTVRARVATHQGAPPRGWVTLQKEGTANLAPVIEQSLKTKAEPGLHLRFSLLEVDGQRRLARTQGQALTADPTWMDTLKVNLPKGSPRPPLLQVQLWGKARLWHESSASCRIT